MRTIRAVATRTILLAAVAAAIPAAAQFGPIHVDHALVNWVTLVAQSATGSCTFGGTYTQAGHMGSVTGNFDCGGGVAGPMQIFEMERTGSGMTARFVAQSGSCQIAGRLGGVERESPRH